LAQIEDPLPTLPSPAQLEIGSVELLPAVAVIGGNKPLMLQRFEVITR
jgi:hypothetical protein